MIRCGSLKSSQMGNIVVQKVPEVFHIVLAQVG
jgi:hypothetical protein